MMRIVLAVVGNRGHDPSAGERAGVFVHHAVQYAAELRFKGVGLRVNASSSLQLTSEGLCLLSTTTSRTLVPYADTRRRLDADDRPSPT